MKKAFTLIEVIIASAILSLTVFGVYKLIGENSKLIGNKDTFIQKNILLYDTKECIDSIGLTAFTSLSNTGYSFNFGPQGYDCFTGSYDTNYSFSGVELSGKTYYLFGEITDSGSTFIDWDINVFEENTGKITKEYKQLP